ncbi:MAG: MFS transporter [Theionarchaea archaeon]|nr:MFS transporter [Theionarchaea archaeon]
MSNSRMLTVTFFTHFTNDGFELVLPTLLPLIVREFSLTYSQTGLLAGSMAITLGGGQFLTGYLSDRTGKRKMLIAAGLICVSVSFYFMGISRSYWELLFWNLLAGLGASVYHPVSISLISQMFGSRKGKAIGIHGGGGNLGMALFPLISGVLAEIYGWRFVFQFFPVFGIVICILFLILIEEKSVKQKTIEFRHLIDHRILLVIITLGFVSMASRGVHIFLPLRLSLLNYSSTDFGLFLSLFNGLGVIGQILGGYLSDILEKTKLVAIFSIISGITMYLLLALDTYYQMIVFVIISGLIFNCVWPILFCLLTDRTPQHIHGTGLGLFFSGGYIMSSTAPILMGIVSDASSMDASFFLIPLFTIVGALVVLKK